MDNEALTRATTKYMVGNLEWSGPAFQAATLFVSGIYDPFIGNGKTVVLCLAALHLLIIPIYLRGFGPLALGGWWMAIYPIQAVTVNGLLAAISQSHTYGNSILCVPGCNYSATMWLFLAYYPWFPPSLGRWRRCFEILMLGSYYAFFLALAWLNNDSLRLINVKSAGISLMWLLIAYVMGIAIAKMCFAAAEKQLEVQQQNFTEFFDFLHSHVKSGIASIKMGLSDVPRTREKLNELEEVVGTYRVELLLAQEQVPLAALFSERIRTFTGVLRMIETPRLGPLTVARPIGVLIGRALGDLLKNAAKYGATEVSIKCELIDGMIQLTVSDNGPGFPPEVIDDESRSLYRLRETARQLGGDLVIHVGMSRPGAVLNLRAPLQLTKGNQ
ncbi:MAG: ATP-binding protein [Pseudonocardiaceae bacterium]